MKIILAYIIKEKAKILMIFFDYNNMIENTEFPQMLISRGSSGRIEVDFNCSNWSILKLKDEKKAKVIEKKVIEQPKVNKIRNTFNFSFR